MRATDRFAQTLGMTLHFKARVDVATVFLSLSVAVFCTYK